MKEKLRKALADDMNIYRFKDETECEYNQRLIYSAGAAWVKTLVYGHSYADNNNKNNYNYVNTDIMYVESHLSKVLEAFLKCFEINTNWLKVDGSGNVGEKARALARLIVKIVLYTYNLAEIQSRRLIPLKTQYFKYGKELYLVRGEMKTSKITYSVGVAQWVKSNDMTEYETERKIVDVKGEDYYRIMDYGFAWKKADLRSEYLIFKKGSKGAYSKCWKPVDINDIPDGINILKLADKYNGGFVLVKRDSNGLKMAELDPWYIEEREIYRILYALNYKNNTPAEFLVKKKEGHYILRYSGAIPNYENRIITCCSWPYLTYDNKYFKIVPDFLWGIVESIILDLGAKIIYQ
jgi:hypothetical protein